MKEIKLFIQLAYIMLLVFSCSKDEVPSNEVKQQNKAEINRQKGPVVQFEQYSNICDDRIGPEVNLWFSSCHYESIFFVNVFKTNGTHVYSWPVENPNLNENVWVTIGASPFTFPNGSRSCSLLSEGNSYYFNASPNVPDTVVEDGESHDSFYVPVKRCHCRIIRD